MEEIKFDGIEADQIADGDIPSAKLASEETSAEGEICEPGAESERESAEGEICEPETESERESAESEICEPETESERNGAESGASADAQPAEEADYGKEIYELSYEASGGFGIEVNRTRYAELRALGLSAKEAFLATSSVATAEADSRAHLGSSVPRSATRPTMGISQRELKEARELFDGASDAEILRLYRRVSAN